MRRRRALTIGYFALVLTLMGIVFGLVAWGLIAQLDVQRRMVRAAERRQVRHAVLAQLRRDMAGAIGLDLIQLDEDDARNVDLILHGPTGDVMYLLREAAVDDHVDRSQEPWGGPRQSLSRQEPGGARRDWVFEGQSCAFVLSRHSMETTARVLEVEIQAEMNYGGGQRLFQRYATTLAAGGLP